MFNGSKKKRIILSHKFKKETPKSFFELSSADQKKIIEKATKKANEDQRDLVKKFDKACV